MSCGCKSAQGLGAYGGSMNTYQGPVPPGVPNPYTPMLHSYPTRYHGPIYTRPMFSLDWSQRPNDFALDESMLGLGADGDDGVAPPPWKLAVGFGLAGLVVWGAIHFFGSPSRA